MSKKNKIILISLLFAVPLVAVGIYAGFRYKQDQVDTSQYEYKTVYWNKLRELDIAKNIAPPDLKALNGERVRVPGFVVPLEDDDTELSEFLLVPNPQACIHVPPPPPNQMVYVRMKKGQAPKREWGPVWLSGVLRIQDVASEFGKVSYQLSGESSAKFEY